MAWKNTQQYSLADALVVKHEALAELDDVQTMIDWRSIEGMLSDIHAKVQGEQAWPPSHQARCQFTTTDAPVTGALRLMGEKAS